MTYFILLFLGISVASVYSEFPVFEGACPNEEVDFIENFNQTEFSGLWYIIERYEEDEYSCCRLDYTWGKEERRYLQLLIQKKDISEEYPIIMFRYNNIREIEPFSNNGKYEDAYRRLKYRFVDTDYDNYAVLWSCFQKLGKHEQNLVIMARDPLYDINSSEALKAILSNPVFDKSLLRQIDHKDKMCEEDLPNNPL